MLPLALLLLAADPAPSLSGVYELDQGSLGGTLHISELDPTRLQFTLELVDTANAHYGVIENQVVQINGRVAIYESNLAGPCRLTFWFFGDSVKIEQDENRWQCGFGVGISATGSYRRQGMFSFDQDNPRITDAEHHELRRLSPEFAAADDRLNDAWKVFRKSLERSQRKAFEEEQAAWLALRDGRALAVAAKGSPAYVEELILATKERTDVLKGATKTAP